MGRRPPNQPDLDAGRRPRLKKLPMREYRLLWHQKSTGFHATFCYPASMSQKSADLIEKYGLRWDPKKFIHPSLIDLVLYANPTLRAKAPKALSPDDHLRMGPRASEWAPSPAPAPDAPTQGRDDDRAEH